MEFIIEQKASQNTKNYLHSLHLKTDLKKELDCEKIGLTIINKKTNNMLFLFSGHSNYPESIWWEFILVYKRKRVFILLESFNPTQHKLLNMEIPEEIWEEREAVMNLGVEMIYWYEKFSGPQKAPNREIITRKSFIVNTEHVVFYKEKN